MPSIELNELYYCLYYGHIIEFVVNDKQYYLECYKNGFDIYNLGEQSKKIL